jgi:glycosyltransferase involved in cell wall biosynthesis
MRKKILIFFPEGNLPYSPTTINLYDQLSKFHRVEIFASPHAPFNLGRQIKYLNGITLGTRVLFVVLRFLNDCKVSNISRHFNLSGFSIYRQLKKHIGRNSYDEVIAVDFFATRMALLLHQKVHLLSLEITNLTHLDKIDPLRLRSVIIQREERYNYLFKVKIPHVFYVQNAPVFNSDVSKILATPRQKRDLVYSGYASKGFGIYACLNFIREYPDYALHVKGAMESDFMDNIIIHYDKLHHESRVVLDTAYLDEDKIVEYLSQFRIGFCFYDFRLAQIDNFNYLSAPAGKLFKYFAAGVPVIGINILGLDSVRRFECGILIDDLSPLSIKKAIDLIEANYDSYTRNALKAAEAYSFDKMLKPFLEFTSQE